MTRHEQRSRITVDLDDDVYDGLQQYVPWGMRRHLINAMLRDALHLMKEHDRNMVMGAIISGDMTMKDYLNKYGEEDDG